MPLSDSTIDAIRAETLRAEAIHADIGDPVRAIAILVEEVGELAADILTATRLRPSSVSSAIEAAWYRAEAEAVQVASVAARIVELVATRQVQPRREVLE